MDDNSAKVDPERDRLMWRSRELLLRNKVLQTQLDAVKRTREATLNASRSIHESVRAHEGQDRWLRLKVKQEQSIADKQIRLNVLSAKICRVKSQIVMRTRRMVRELWLIYPVIEFPDRKGYSICDIHLPSSERFEGHDETMVSVAIGYVAHLLLLLSEILDIALRFPLKYYGSKSLIYCNRKNQLFPLYVDSFKSREWVNFAYGISLLNLDIVQIRTLYGLTTSEPDDTLANLHGLKLFLDSDD